MATLVSRTHWTSQVQDSSGRSVLDRNENCDAGLRSVLAERFLKELNPDHVIRYPDIHAAYLATAKLTRLSPDRLFLGAGSEQLIRAVLYAHSARKLGGSRRPRLYYPDPTYAMVSVYGRLFDYELVPIPYRYSRSEGEFILDDARFMEAEHLDVIYIPSPDNLTGRVFEAAIIERICGIGCRLILDHAYIAFAGGSISEENHAIADRFENVAIVSSYSKTAGVAGLRIGHLYSHPDTIARVYEDKPMYEISGVACAYVDFLSRNEALLETTVRAILAGKQFIEEHFAASGGRRIRSNGNFSVFEKSCLFDSLRRVALIRDFQVGQDGFVRITSPDFDTARTLVESIR